MKTHFKLLRNPNYIGSWDLAKEDGTFAEKVVTIVKTTKELVHDGNGGQSECCIIHLAECKPMIANATNLKSIKKAFQTPYVEDWVGKKIILTVKKVKAFGEVHNAIRVSDKPFAKPELIAGSKEFEKCKAALKNGYKMEQLKEKYEISNEVEAQLNG